MEDVQVVTVTNGRGKRRKEMERPSGHIVVIRARDQDGICRCESFHVCRHVCVQRAICSYFGFKINISSVEQ